MTALTASQLSVAGIPKTPRGPSGACTCGPHQEPEPRTQSGAGAQNLAEQTSGPNYALCCLSRLTWPKGLDFIWITEAAPSQKPSRCFDALQTYYSPTTTANVSLARPTPHSAPSATDALREAGEKVATFNRCGHPAAKFVFTAQRSEAINLVARSWAMRTSAPADEIFCDDGSLSEQPNRNTVGATLSSCWLHVPGCGACACGLTRNRELDRPRKTHSKRTSLQH